MTLLSGGSDYSVNPSGADITGFDPTRDRLDFGDMSVHGVILGKLEDGSAVIVNPWQEGDYQRILTADGTALRWDQITLDNIAPVGNEHLRADLGAVLSWENSIGPLDAAGTVYVRSHEYGVQERIEGFDPSSDKLNFLYLGTRERVSATDTDEGLLITVQPSQQSVLLVGVSSSELVGRNLEFHFDQIEEDNLETVFGFQAADLSLVDRTVLLTPEAPAGATTDGYQTRIGSSVTSSGLPAAGEPMPMDGSMHDHAMEAAAGPLSLEASGNLYWGGMSGQLTITNTSNTAMDGWQVSFLTPHADFQSWAGDARVEQVDGGQYRVTLTPAAWNGSIAAGSSITVGFNAVSNGLPNSGALTSALFFSEDSTPLTDVSGGSALQPPEPPAQVIPEPDVTPQPDPVSPVSDTAAGPLSLEASGNLYWGGMSGQLTITNTSNTAVDGWQVSFLTPHADFQSWAGDARVEQVDGGQYRVTLTPAAWNGSIAAGSSISVGFNAVSNGLPNSGALTSALFFSDDSTPITDGTSPGALQPPADVTPQLEVTPPPVVDGSTVYGSTPPEPTAPEPTSDPVDHLVSEPSPANSFSNGERMVAYFEEWGIYSRDYLVQDIPVGDLTHINYSFFDVKANGDVTLFDPWAATDKRFTAAEQVSRTFSASAWSELSDERQQAYSAGGAFTTRTNADGSVTVSGVPVGWESSDALAGNLGQLELLSQLHPDINLGIALGGWTLSDEFSLALDDAAGREVFTDNLIATLQTYDFFNTIDFDWEYPGGGGLAGNASSSQDGVNFAATLQLLRQKLDLLSTQTGEQYEISVATAGGADKLANLNLSGLDPYVDFYNVMAYDFHGGWESTTGHQAAMTADPGGYDVVTAVEQFRQNGVALDKVVLGAPAYTRAWGEVSTGDSYGLGESGRASAAPGSFEAGNYDLKDLITGIEDDTYDLIWDDEAKAAYAYNDSTRVWSSVETAATIAGKAAYVNEAGLGGMMFWALSNDAPDDQSLIAAASDVLSGAMTADVVAERSPGFDAVVGGDGAFSINDFTDLA